MRGHTQAADAYRKGREILAMNTRCWLEEEDPGIWNNPDEKDSDLAKLLQRAEVVVRQ